MLTPTSRRSRRSCQPRIFGPRTSADGCSSAACNNRSRHVRSGALSSCRSHTHRTTSSGNAGCRAATDAKPAEAADPKPSLTSRWTTASAPSDSRSTAGLESCEALSTPITEFTGRVWRASVVKTAGSQTSPSWLTTMAVTKCSRDGSPVSRIRLSVKASQSELPLGSPNTS